MSKYELLLILPGTLDEKEAETRLQEIVAVVKDQTSDVVINTMGKNRLAYPIKQIRYGYYYAITFKAEAKKVNVLENKLGLMRDVLRAVISHFNMDLTAQQKLAYSNEQAMQQPREDKEAAPAEEVMKQVSAMVEEKEADTKTDSKAARKLDQTNIDEINKKLDDLMSGDVIPKV